MLPKLERITDSDGWRWYYRETDDDTPARWMISVTQILSPVVHERLQSWFKKQDYGAQEKKRKETADIGTLLHDLIAADLRGEKRDIPDNVKDAFENWQVLKGDYDITASVIETPMCSDLYGFAGTPDLIGTYEGKRAVLDIKTGAYSIKTGWQLAAYRQMWQEQTGEKLSMVGLQIHRDGEIAKPFVYEYLDECWLAFLSCLNVWRMLYFNKLKKQEWSWLHVPLVQAVEYSDYVVARVNELHETIDNLQSENAALREQLAIEEVMPIRTSM